jgi:hypothetical protein
VPVSRRSQPRSFGIKDQNFPNESGLLPDLMRSHAAGLAGPMEAGPRLPAPGGPNVFEMTWDNDGRATFSHGAERVPGQAHVIWRRIGAHDISTPPPGP